MYKSVPFFCVFEAPAERHAVRAIVLLGYLINTCLADDASPATMMMMMRTMMMMMGDDG